MKNLERLFAEKLLKIKAIKLQPANPFTWASGWKSPFYCDNRKTLSYPSLRSFVKFEITRLVLERFGQVDAIAGVATGAIPQGALVADALNLPFVYVRSTPKDHGLENLIEGELRPGMKVVVVEDLISTGGSSLKAVEAIRRDGCEVIGMVAAYTYGFPEVRQFNLMFSTDMGSTADGSMKIYLRPETAQGIFVNYLNVQKTGRMKVPFGIAQIGKAFRNEIVARQFIFRMREFEQMEMQFFVRPGSELEYFKKWKEIRLKWHKALGFGDDHYRFHDHDKLAHYANAATDIEFLMPFGFKEVEGIHSRTNFDLSQHEKFSGKSIKYFDPELNESYTPYVIETSIGVDRMFLSIMSAAYCEEQLENGESRVVLKLPAALAPVKLAVMPLVKKDGLPEKAREIIDNLKFHFHCQYDEKDSIGKRYRRQDAIGTPYCVTVDHQTLEDNCVTLRNRDTMEQERVAISELNNIIADRVSITSLLKTIQ